MATKKKQTAKKATSHGTAKGLSKAGVAPKPAAKKPAAKKPAAKKSPAKKSPAKKSAAKKPAKNATAKKATAKKPAKKATAKKAPAKKAPAKKAPAKKASTTTTPAHSGPPSSSAKPARANRPAKPIVRDAELDIAQALAALALDKKAEDVLILKVTDLTSYADGFVLASAPSERQVQAIARAVDDEMRKAGKPPVGNEGMEQGHWVLVDFGAVVLHVFLSSARKYYDLEGFWQDAPRVAPDEAYGKAVVARMIADRAAVVTKAAAAQA